jgi:hypothetical protein
MPYVVIMGSWRFFAPFFKLPRGPLEWVAVAVLALGAWGLGGCAVGVDTAGPTGEASPAAATQPPSEPAPSYAPPAAAPLPFGARGGEWTWVDFADSRCADGSPTGLGVNVRPGATKLVLFLQGGGACADGEGCWGPAPTAVHLTGYGVDEFAGETQLASLALFDRSAGSPFADASFVFVPYCTGDLHAGNAVASYALNGQDLPTWHYGAHNLDLYLAALAQAFPGLDRVWLAGESAGGFGTLFNQAFVARALGARTDVIDDSGPGIGSSGYPDSWNVRLPPGCDDCKNGLQALFDYDRGAYPDARFGFLSFQIDVLLPGFYGATEQDVVAWLAAFESGFASLQNTAWFVAPGAGHVVLGSPLDAGTRAALGQWLAAMAGGDAWRSTTQ